MFGGLLRRFKIPLRGVKRAEIKRKHRPQYPDTLTFEFGEIMPFKSKSQRRYFYAAASRGEIPSSTVKEFERATKDKKLPEKVKAKKKRNKSGFLKAMG